MIRSITVFVLRLVVAAALVFLGAMIMRATLNPENWWSLNTLAAIGGGAIFTTGLLIARCAFEACR